MQPDAHWLMGDISVQVAKRAWFNIDDTGAATHGGGLTLLTKYVTGHTQQSARALSVIGGRW